MYCAVLDVDVEDVGGIRVCVPFATQDEGGERYYWSGRPYTHGDDDGKIWDDHDVAAAAEQAIEQWLGDPRAALDPAAALGQCVNCGGPIRRKRHYAAANGAEVRGQGTDELRRQPTGLLHHSLIQGA